MPLGALAYFTPHFACVSGQGTPGVLFTGRCRWSGL